MLGAKGPHGMIEMGSMFTTLKIRDKLADDTTDPGWYVAPAGSTAIEATADELTRDGIVP